MDFLRQTSTVAALVGAASSGLILPTRPASAYGIGSKTSKTEDARAVGAAERMVWLNEDSGTVSTRLSQADETYGQGFVAYLARFLLNYDEGCREYFKAKLDFALPKRDGSEVWEEFRVRPDVVSGFRLFDEGHSRGGITPHHNRNDFGIQSPRLVLVLSEQQLFTRPSLPAGLPPPPSLMCRASLPL